MILAHVHVLFFSHVVNLVHGDVDFRLACDQPTGGIYVKRYDWNTLRNRTSFEHLPSLDKKTARMLSTSPSPDYIFSAKELLIQCFIGTLVLNILSQWTDSESAFVESVTLGYPWVYLRPMVDVTHIHFARILWSHWNLFGVLHRFLKRLPLHGLPLPLLEKKADNIFVTALLRAHNESAAASSSTSGGWSSNLHFTRELPPHLIQEAMQSEDAEVRAAATLVYIQHIVARSFARGTHSYEDIHVWEFNRWGMLQEGHNRFLEEATDLLLNSLPSKHTFEACFNDIRPTSSHNNKFTTKNLRACWPRNAWGGRLVFPLLEHMGHEWISYAMRGQEPHRWTSTVMHAHLKYFSNQADLVHAANMVQLSLGVLTVLEVSPVVKHDRFLLSATEACWDGSVLTPEHCCNPGGVRCFHGVFTQGRCCDEAEDTRTDNDESVKKESVHGTWAIILLAHDEASAQLLSETVSLVAFQVQGIELSRRQKHRPFVAITDAQTMRVLSDDIKGRLEEHGVTLKLVSKTVFDLDDPRFPPSGNKTYYGKYEHWAYYWHKLYMWDPSMWNNEVPVVLLDADMLPVHEGLLEAFSLPKTTSLAVGHLYSSGTKSFKSMPMFNTGFMVVHPDPLVFALIADKAYAGWGFPPIWVEQSWLDDLFHQFSVRYYMKVPGPAWDTWFDHAAHDNKSPTTTDFLRWNPKTLDLLPPHIVLPHAYNFCVDSKHAALLSDGGEGGGADLIVNSVWLPGLGFQTDRPLPRLLHFPGFNSKPWDRCSKAARSVVDAWWWKAHGLMCSKSKKPCFLECDQ